MFYPLLFRGLVWPLYERLAGKAIPRFSILLERSQWWSPERLADWQGRQLVSLLEHAAARVPFYTQWFRSAGLTPGELLAGGGFQLLPPADKTLLMDAPENFQAAPPLGGTFSKTTGGSTGKPLHFLVDPLSDDWRQAMSRRGYAWAGCRFGEGQLYFWGGDILPQNRLHRLKVNIKNRLTRTYMEDCFRLDQKRLDQVLESMDRLGPANLVGYTTPLAALARRAGETGRRPARPLVSALTGAEALYPAQREVIEKGLCCPVYETYGSREFMLIAAQCERREGLHLSSENLIVEVLKDGRPARPGELGEVVITDLHNYAQPFIRYRTGDLAEPGEPCACGRGLPTLARVEGRILDVIRAPGGQALPGEFFPHFLKDFPAVDSYQVVQAGPDRLEIRYVPRGTLSAGERELILGQVGSRLPGVEVALLEVPEIPPTAAGKRRVAIGWEREGGRC